MKGPVQFGKYYLLERIAVGGMAEVFRGKTFGLEGSERIVSVKRILPLVAADKELVTMFIDEAKLAIQLNHPNICQVFDWGKADDSYYIAMEYVSGKDLRAVFQRCKKQLVDGAPIQPIAQSCFVVMKLCEGLDYAHTKKDQLGNDLGLVHRDVSPQNVMLSYEGEVKLIDFGIAKVKTDGGKHTETGVLKGKFAYMSPEQVRGDKLDRRSDIFSAGIVLYELLTGERLFPVDNDLTSLERIRNAEVLPPSAYNRKIPEDLERITMKALSKEPADRYQTAMELHDELQSFMYTSGEFYSRKELSAWLKRVFRDEMDTELAALDSAREFKPTGPPPPVAGEGGARARVTSAVAALRASGEAAGGLRVQKEQSGVLRALNFNKELAARGAPTSEAPSSWTPSKGKQRNQKSSPPPPPRGAVQNIAEAAGALAKGDSGARKLAVKGGSVPPGAQALGPYQSEEDTAVDGANAGGRVVDPASDGQTTRHVEGNAGRSGPIPAAIDEGPTKAFTPADQSDIEGNDTDDQETRPVPQAAAEVERPAAAPRSGAAATVKAAETVPTPRVAPAAAPVSAKPVAARLPEPMPSEQSPVPVPPQVIEAQKSRSQQAAPPVLVLPQPLEPQRPPPQQPQKSSNWVGVGLVVLALTLLSIGGAAFWLFGRTGDLTIVAEPGNELVTVLVDQRVVAVANSPVTVKLQPGSHLVAVQRNGFSPWSEVINVGTRESLFRQIKLESQAPKTGGFTLISDPPGAQALLDGSPLGQVTPMRVQSVLAGPHTLELKLGTRTHRQQVNIEPGQLLELRITMPPPVEVTPTAGGPIATPEGPKTAPIEPTEPPKVAVEQPVKPTTEPPKPVKVDVRKGPKKPREPSRPVSDTPTARAAGNNGYLRINSRPWTKIIVDGVDTGLNTPQLSYRVNPGTHTVMLFNPQFGIKESISVTVRAGETQTIARTFKVQQ